MAVDNFVWAVASVAAPLAASYIASCFSWRLYYLFTTICVFIVMVVGLAITEPRQKIHQKEMVAKPWTMVLFVCAAIVVNLVSYVPFYKGVGLFFISAAFIALAIRLERQNTHGLFPRRAFFLMSDMGKIVPILFFIALCDPAFNVIGVLYLVNKLGFALAAISLLFVIKAFVVSISGWINIVFHAKERTLFWAVAVFTAGTLLLAISIFLKDYKLIALAIAVEGFGYEIVWLRGSECIVSYAGKGERATASIAPIILVRIGYACGAGFSCLLAGGVAFANHKLGRDMRDSPVFLAVFLVLLIPFLISWWLLTSKSAVA